MSLPPDPHDDDVDTPAPAGAPPPPPPPPPPPSPAAAASTEPAPSGAYTPPPSPAYKQSATSERPTRAGMATATPEAGTPAAGPAAHLAPEAAKPRGKRKGKGWLVAAVLVVAALGAAAAVVLLGGDDEGDTEEAAPGDQRDALREPVEVATAFFTALEDRDCEAMIDNLTTGSLFPEEQSPEQTLATCQAALDSGTTGFEGVDVGTITLASMEGDVATVSVDFDIGGQVTTENFELHLVDGEWKLDLPGSV
jgi:hypothetical protein